MIERVRVRAQPQVENYDVVIEPGCMDRLAQLVPPAPAYAVISDSTVAQVYTQRAVTALPNAFSISFPAGEHSKNASTWESLTNDLLRKGLGRDGCVIALGGGVTGDLAGFVAATYMRGVRLVQIPTTLLAMIDASIGGKTGIDAGAGKNLIGAFHQPEVVLIDPLVLRTLPHEELRYGLAEAIKHGAIADADYFSWIAESAASIFEHKLHTLAALVKRSVEIKAHFVNEDVHERGARAALNFGHTIAHALEHATGYTMAHGQAVAVGMIVEAAAGETAGMTQTGTVEHLRVALSTLGLPTGLPNGLSGPAILAATRTDKKTRGGEQYYTLIRRIGEIARDDKGNWTTPLPDDVVLAALARLSIT